MKRFRPATRLLTAIGLGVVLAAPDARTAYASSRAGAAPLSDGNSSPESAPTVRVETDVRERFFDVRGTNAEEIFSSIARQGLGGDVGLAASGLTRSEISFDLAALTAAESCRLDSVDLRITVTVTLPRHAHPLTLDEEVRRQWKAYEALVEFHEYRHVEIEFQGIQELQETLERTEIERSQGGASACHASVRRAIDEQTIRTRERHEAFHAREARDVRARQEELLREIADLDASLQRQRGRIADLDAETAELDREHAALANAGDVRSAEELRAERKRLVASRNALAERHNEALGKRPTLVTRLSWTR